MTNAAKIEKNESVVVADLVDRTPHELVPSGYRQWVPPAMPVLPVEKTPTKAEIPAKKRPLVYLAGPYTQGDPEINTRCQRRIMTQLMADGVVTPYSPLSHSHEAHLQNPQSYEVWMDHSFAVLETCDALLRSAADDGSYYQWESSGADREVEFCVRNGIPVFQTVSALYEWANSSADDKQPIRTFETGATRSNDADNVRFDLIPQLALMEIAKVLSVGAIRYGEHDYRKGFPFSDVVNHLLRHLNLYLRGDKSENHLSHAACNVLFLLEYEHIHPELNDLLTADDYLPPKAANGV